jgi:hypothetical protein
VALDVEIARREEDGLDFKPLAPRVRESKADRARLEARMAEAQA